MVKSLKYFVLILGIAFVSTRLQAQGYEIKVKIPNYKNSTLILGHHFANPSSLYPDDTIKLDAKGIGVFKKKKTLTGGVYIIFMPEKKNYFDILLGSNQKFSIEADTFNFIKTVKFIGSPDNTLFYDYQNYLSSKREQADKIAEEQKNAKTKAEKDTLGKRINTISNEVKEHVANLIKQNANSHFALFIKSVQDIDVPDFPKDASGKITDSLFQARYYKQHYFDNFDFADVRLLYSPLYEQKIKTYFEKVILPAPDSIIKEVDYVLEKGKNDTLVFKYLLLTLFNQYAKATGQIMGMDAVYVHIGEKYYLPYGTWSDKKFRDDLKKNIDHMKPNLIGKTAPEIKLIQLPGEHFMAAKNDTALKSNPYVGTPLSIKDIQSKYLVVIFWEADCGHCKKTIPLLHDSVYSIIKAKGAEVLAIHIMSSVEGKRKWIDFVNDHNMYEWINAWSPYSLDFKDLYDVYSTPKIFLLDENKKIIAKQIDIKQIESVIDMETKRKLK